MRYRAIAVDLLIDNHPVQFFSNDELVIRRWAAATALAHKCIVRVYERTETLADEVERDGYTRIGED